MAAPLAGHVRSRTTSRAPLISTRVGGLTALSTIVAPAASTRVSRTDTSGTNPVAALLGRHGERVDRYEEPVFAWR